MPEEYEINRVLEEIAEDEKVSKPKHKKITQQEIRKILREKKKALQKLDGISKIPLGDVSGLEDLITAEQQAEKESLPSIEVLLQQFVRSRGSELLITAGVPPALKAGVSLVRTRLPSLNTDQCEAYAKALMTDNQWEKFLREKEIDFALSIASAEARFRISIYRQKNIVSLAVRRIGNSIPTFEELGLPEWLQEYALKPQGLIVITAPPGHGKSTTAASMIDVINRNRRANIITLEDPIEYLHRPQRSNINQREIGTDTNSLSEGLRRVFRQSPDVILVGEIPDHETFEAALKAASTGHLVLCTMNAGNSTSAIDDLMNHLPNHLQNHVSRQLANSLLIVFSQRLMARKGTDGVVLAYEKLINSRRISGFIRENRVHEIRSQIQPDSDDFSSMDVDFDKLVKEGLITLESALHVAEIPEHFQT